LLEPQCHLVNAMFDLFLKLSLRYAKSLYLNYLRDIHSLIYVNTDTI
jgi:hypothetical protein